MAAEATLPPYRNRVIGLRVMPVGELLDNPRNWRTHPRAQQAGLDALGLQPELVEESGETV